MLPIRPSARSLAALAVAMLAISACRRSPEPATAPPVEADTPPAPPVLKLPPPVVGRSDLLRALDAASSAYAAGDRDESADLSGRRFVVRQTFGCSGPTPASNPTQPGLASWSWGPKNQTIVLRLQPADWKSWIPAGEADEPWDAVEGFWLARPWLKIDGCPALRSATLPPLGAAGAPDPPAVVSRQTAGLAALFAPGGSRVGRRSGKAFTHTVRVEDGDAATPGAGYRLVLEGRFRSFSGGRAIRCLAGHPDERPVCIAAATIDRLAFESASGDVLTEWR